MIPTHSTADLHDSLQDSDGAVQALAPGLSLYGGRRAYCGPIATLAPAGAGCALRLRDILSEAGRGRVLVADARASEEWALLGDQLAALGQRNGWSGVVLNGCVRDVGALRHIDIGVHALGAIPSRPRQFDPVQREQPVAFLRARFAPGAWLYADEDGVIVCSERQPAAS